MALLDAVNGPDDLKRMSRNELAALAAEIRAFLVDKVRAAGGHLGPNLGVVELTLAVHRVFDSPKDSIVYDVGHQSYVHKLVTGRRKGFDRLRQRGGVAGYPSREESEHDLVENSHASTALSYADGLSKAYELAGGHRSVVAVVGDGALTGGMCWEALNNIAAANRPVVIVVNDNGRSYLPTIGGIAERLAALRLRPGYEQFLEYGKTLLQRTPVVGKPLYAAAHAAKAGLKDALSPQALFADLDLKYIGPVDGHDLGALEAAMSKAKAFGGPVIVHAVTQKGYGYPPAVNDETDQMHQTDAIDPATGKPPAKGTSWTSVFGHAIAEIADERPDVVAITAAMLHSTGLHAFADRYPERVFDVGIAEQHAVTSAAGLAMGGMHPVVAVYSTFLNRGFDQLLLDVGLHRQPVTFVLDRAGITGPDGPSHHGMWDLSLLGTVPGMAVAAPRDAVTLREELREAVATSGGPTALRYSKGTVPQELPAHYRTGTVDVLRTPDGEVGSDVLLVPVGAFAELGLQAASKLADQGIGVTVADPRWILPVPGELVELAARHRLVVTVEDSGRHGGFGAALAAALRDAGCDVPLRDLAVPQEYHEHGSRSELLTSFGLTSQDIARRVTEWVADRLAAPETGAELAAPELMSSRNPQNEGT
ncbi:1-deoxy-D-xylulose-5-phosphate synthase [Haloechinothrix sp. LS1_15]|uniref:1-deoxy-D-xylulose-5-phosphate synthase n=1 Tax=Haloechinothrix sp. LS1_15 TaxID=2652248 RepID=UPI0029451A62|nr:1-deoxy-D-xylulose-5-phosphate synthase [Haloechinothrix sp. LS1_15]MDV6014452.1 1-deoxy-D-xylulose-5-phosphate synthase [Haloechinothrix sp. LS1_15]